MERLTKINEKYIEYSDENYNNLIDNHTMLEKCLRKLAEYEDLEEQGLLLRLPCKVGDTVYKVWPCSKNGKSIAEFEISHIYVDNPQFIEFSMISKKNKNATYPYRFFKDFEIGKTVFLTKEEAEHKLKEMESD